MKKRKLGLILAPLAVIAVCISLIAGSTFALFTSESDVGITISAGKVDVATTVSAGEVQSPVEIMYNKETGEASATGLEASKHATAKVVGNELTVSKMLPGDEVTFDVAIANLGDNAKVQYSFECTKGLELMSALDVSGLGLDVETFQKYTSDWFVLNKDATKTLNVTLKLPLEETRGNGEEATIKVNVFAIQENVTVEGGEELVTIANGVGDLKKALSNGGSIALMSDVTYSGRKIEIANDLSIDLNGKTLKGVSSLNANAGTHLAVKNGTLDLDAAKAGNGLSAIYIETGSTLDMQGVNLKTTGYGVFVEGNLATGVKGVVNATDCVIDCVYGSIGTNASGNGNRSPVEINLTRVEINSQYCGILLNVPGELNVTDCNITACDQALLIRGGTATVTNSTLKATQTTAWAQGNAAYDNWATGTATNSGALVLGGKNSAAYKYPTNVTLNNVTLVGVEGGAPAVYMWSHKDYDCNLTYDAATLSKVGGSVVVNGDHNFINGDAIEGELTALPAINA